MQDPLEPVGGFFAHMATMGEDYWQDCLTSGTGVPLLDLLDAEYEHYENVLGLEPEEEINIKQEEEDMDDVYPWSYPTQPPEPPAEQLYMVEPKKTVDHTYLAMRVASNPFTISNTHNTNSINSNKRSRDESSSADESVAKEPPRKKRAVTLKKSRSLLRTTAAAPAAPSTSAKTTSVRKGGRGRTLGRPDTPQSSGSEAEEDNSRLNMAPPGKVTGQYLPALNPCNVLVDHNYQSKAIKPDLLGVQTPSDSEDERLEGQQLSNGIVLPESSAPDEEEIDVVSVNGISSFTGSTTQVSNSGRPSRGSTSSRFSSNHHSTTTGTTTTRTGRQTNSRRLPTNPTTQTRRGLEVRLGTLITTAHRNIHRRIMDDEQLRHHSEDDDDDEEEEEEEVRERLSAPKTTTTRRRAATGRRSRGGDREDKSMEDKNKKRCMHNDMERLRRVDLKNSFDNLKVLVPSIASTSKCAKVTILKESKLCVNNLHRTFIKLDSKRAFLKTEQEIFRDRLKRLRSSLWNLFRVRM